MNATPSRIVEKLVDCINAHSVDGIVGLLSEDHLFVDGVGQAIRGKGAMREAWKTYLEWMPDYRIDIELEFERENDVGLFGTASGTYAVGGELRRENRWSIPAAWRAVVRDGKVSEWHVYADNGPVSEVMARCARPRESG